MNWDKRGTQRRPDAPPPNRDLGADIIYVGEVKSGTLIQPVASAGLKVGDSLRILPGAAICIGRSQRCEIVLDAPEIAKAHALLTFLPGPQFELALVDLGSEHGTAVGRRTAPVHTLYPGDDFNLAKRFCFRCQPVSRASTEKLSS